MHGESGTADEVIARLATASKGVVTRRELLGAGVTAQQIETRLARGSLLLQFRGVYRVGHAAPSIETSYLAAVRACGTEALLCGRAGAYLWRLVFDGDAPVTLSALERRFLKLVKEADLPLPITNRVAGGRRVDCRWPEQRFTVELDSYTYHRSRHAWEQDRRREREAYARGDELRRYTYGDVFDRPALVQRELRELLQR